MADEQEKTFEPTEHKINEARKKGDIAKSQEINTFSVLFIGTFYIILNFNFISEHISNIFNYSLKFNNVIKLGEFDKTNIEYIITYILKELGYILLPLMVLIFVVAIVSNISQFGFLFNSLKIDVTKLNPISGFKQLFSKKKIIDFTKMLIKIIILLGLLIIIIFMYRNQISNIMLFSFSSAIHEFFRYITYILTIVIIIIGIFSIIDLIVVRKNYFNKLKMSIQEMKDEYKNMEGNPEVKQKIKEMQAQLAQRESLNEVANSKVVITNPDHYAVAIAQEADFEKQEFSDPIVVAKGKNEVAFKIKQIANENNVEIVENKTLARALFKNVEVGQSIPEEFMQIIFDILIQLDYIQSNIKK